MKKNIGDRQTPAVGPTIKEKENFKQIKRPEKTVNRKLSKGQNTTSNNAFTVILRILSIITGIGTIPFCFILFQMLTDKDGPFSETPFIIGFIAILIAVTLALWYLSMDLSVSRLCLSLSFVLFIVGAYFSFTPLATVSTPLLGDINLGNIITFQSDSSYEVLWDIGKTEVFDEMYRHRLFLLAGIYGASVLLFALRPLKRRKK